MEDPGSDPSGSNLIDYDGHHFSNAEPLDTSLEWGSILEAKQYVYGYALRNGFVALTTSTTKDKRHCILSCNKRGSCKSRSKGFRNRRSQKCGCKWHVNIWIKQDCAKADDDFNTSSRRYRITSAYLKHNHPPMTSEESIKVEAKRRRSTAQGHVLNMAEASQQVKRYQQQQAKEAAQDAQVFQSVELNQDVEEQQNHLQLNLETEMTNDLHQCVNQLYAQAQQVDKATHEDILLQVQLLIRYTNRAIELQRCSLLTRGVACAAPEMREINSVLDIEEVDEDDEAGDPTHLTSDLDEDTQLQLESMNTLASMNTRVRRCKKCRQVGHDIRVCPLKRR